MLQRLTIGIFHAVRYPSKIPFTFHRYLPLHIGQRMLTRITRFALEPLLESLPVLLQFRPSALIFSSVLPIGGIKQVFSSMLIRSVVPQLGLM